MELEKHLVLNKYFLKLFGFSDFDKFGEKIKGDTEEGYDTSGRSYFVNDLIGLKPDWENLLLRYDESIREYVERLRQNRKQPNFNLKYFQYLAVIFTEIFLDRYYNDRQRFLNELNAFLEEFNNENRTDIARFTEEDLKKLAFGMATGSGKTLIMHINYWQILKYSNGWDNIILITPNEGLSKQHYGELKLSGIPCKLYDGNIDNLKTKDKEVLVIDIYKLTKEKAGKGVSIDISYFDGKNLVFIDEGHKGQQSEEQTWKKLREEIGKNGFLFEYSATFGQVIGKNKDLLEEYAKAIIFDYSYKYFYTDGYGKDFYVYNIKEDTYTEAQRDLLLTAGLLSFYEQLAIFEEYNEKLREYNIEKPLWIFVGSTVIKKKSSSFTNEEKKTASDVERVIKFIQKILENENYLRENIKKILEGKSGIIDNEGNDIFKGKFGFVRKTDMDSLVESVYQKVFGGRGQLELYEIKNAEGEVGLRISTEKKYFGVITIGDVGSLKKLVLESDIEIKKDTLYPRSMFPTVKNFEETKHINIVIGSKKFIEGWNNWRVSNMGLINMGKGEGPQIIQLFGRGVRLKGKNYSLKREENPDYILKTMQTLFIYGLDADYVNKFLTTIEKEGVNYEEIAIPIRFNMTKEWEGKIYTIKTEDFNFLEYPIRLTVNENILKNVKIDLRPRITVAHGLDVKTADMIIDEPLIIPDEYLEFIDWDAVYSEIMNYKIAKGMYNLIIDMNTIKQIIKLREYKVFLSESPGISIETNGRPVLKINSYGGIKKFQEIILMVIRDYILKFYRKEERGKTMDYLVVEPLTVDNHLSMYPENREIVLKIPKDMVNDIQEIMKQLEEYDPNKDELPEIWKNWNSFIVHLDNHLYTPLIIWAKNKDKIRSVPVKLNKGETKFVKDFKNFLKRNNHLFEDKDIFLLRNLSRKGIGFFISSGFYPDFIIWVRKENKQYMIFIDPKGLLTSGVRNFNHDKINLCVSYIKDINKKINKDLKRKKEAIELQLYAFILSVSSFMDIKDGFGEGNHTKEDFEEHNIIFQEDPEYLKKIFEKVGVV